MADEREAVYEGADDRLVVPSDERETFVDEANMNAGSTSRSKDGADAWVEGVEKSIRHRTECRCSSFEPPKTLMSKKVYLVHAESAKLIDDSHDVVWK